MSICFFIFRVSVCMGAYKLCVRMFVTAENVLVPQPCGLTAEARQRLLSQLRVSPNTGGYS